jgi:hypothetical protein
MRRAARRPDRGDGWCRRRRQQRSARGRAAIPKTLAVVSVSRSSSTRSVITSLCRVGNLLNAAISVASMLLSASPFIGGSWPKRGTSRRRRRHKDTRKFMAVRSTQAFGAGWWRTMRHDVHARANASDTGSSASLRSPTVATTARKQESRLAS